MRALPVPGGGMFVSFLVPGYFLGLCCLKTTAVVVASTTILVLLLKLVCVWSPPGGVTVNLRAGSSGVVVWVYGTNGTHTYSRVVRVNKVPGLPDTWVLKYTRLDYCTR